MLTQRAPIAAHGGGYGTLGEQYASEVASGIANQKSHMPTVNSAAAATFLILMRA